MSMIWVLAVFVGSWMACSLGCNPDFCLDKTHGNHYCDPADSSSYYICDHGDAKHFTCHTDLVYDGSVCNYPASGVCVPNPVPDPQPGIVVNGICVASVTTGSSATSTTSATSATSATSTTFATSTTSATSGTTPVPAAEKLRNIYRRHPQKSSACAVQQTLTVVSAIYCASSCLRNPGCTDFNFSKISSGVASHDCHLLACATDHLLAPDGQMDFYEQI